MKAVVMAGGAGSRLRPLTVGRPKPMVPLVNKPVLAHILDLLRQHDITDVVVTLQYMASMIEDYFGDGSALGMRITYVVEDSPLGTAGSVLNARQHLDETFLVISGDAATNFNLQEIVESHRKNDAPATIVLHPVREPRDYGVIVTDGEGRITRFQEKPSWGEVASDTVNTGIYVLEPEVLDLIPGGQPYDWGSQAFPSMLSDGLTLYGCIPHGYWCDIGNFAEYRGATDAVLGGRVCDLATLGTHIGGDIWVGRDVQIAPDAQLFGPIYLGNEVQVKGKVVIRGPSVVRDYSIVDNRAQIDRSIIWRNCYIGEDAELRGAIVGRQCSIKAKAALYEGVVIGESCLIGEGALLHAGIKLWPGKEIDAGAVVKTSIIWGSQGRRVLFGRYGVTGVVNVDLTPEFAARLGAAFGATLPRGSIVTINRDPHPGSRMLKRATISGLPSAGCHVSDLRSVPIPVARFYTRYSPSSGGVHVRISPHDQRVVDIRFFGSDGLNLSNHEERTIERVFFREDFRRAYLDDVGTIDYALDAIPLYQQEFLAHIDQNAIREASLDVVVDYAFASTSLVMPELFQELGVNTTPLGARIDASYISLMRESFEQECSRLATIVAALGSDLGVRLDVGGEKMFVADEKGSLVSDGILCAAMAELALRANPGGVIAVPVNQSMIFEEIARKYGGSVLRTRVDLASLMQAGSQAKVIMAADGIGTYVFPSFVPVADAMFAMAKLLEFLAQQNVRLSEVVSSLPSFHVQSSMVDCPWNEKGTVMRRLHQKYAGSDVQVVDGIKIFLSENEWVLARPDPDRALFRVTAEGKTPERAQQLLDEHTQMVAALADAAD
ncbi:MAG: sugar phosphate nucleotidyltransferase [Chloroflexota bacterium]|nr:sugar phosphate nucleotidyltransferase [Chloroflexota bacterium]